MYGIENLSNPGEEIADGDLYRTFLNNTLTAWQDLYYRKVTEEVAAERDARQWRDIELTNSDTASQTPDWPNRDAIITYRAALREWPSTEDFPATKPELG